MFEHLDQIDQRNSSIMWCICTELRSREDKNGKNEGYREIQYPDKGWAIFFYHNTVFFISDDISNDINQIARFVKFEHL